VEEANRLNGTVEPTINGKPYSQYKAEQDALKQKMQKSNYVVPTVPAQYQLVQQSWSGRPPEQNTVATVKSDPSQMIGGVEKAVVQPTQALQPKESRPAPVIVPARDVVKAESKVSEQKTITAPGYNRTDGGNATINTTSGQPEVIVNAEIPKQESKQSKQVPEKQ
jgi:hypothetical protein